jgi:hypothetical protein
MRHDPVLVSETKAWIQKAMNDLRAAQIDLDAAPPQICGGRSQRTGEGLWRWRSHAPGLFTILSLALFPVVLCPVSHGSARAPVPRCDEVAVVGAEFGLLDLSDSDGPQVQPSTKIPLKEGQGYGWVIQLETRKLKVKWREELLLPAAPQTWGDGEKQGEHTISPDRKLCVTEQEVVVDRGLVFNAWEVAPGDPRGRYIIRVFVNDRLVRIFEFDVE